MGEISVKTAAIWGKVEASRRCAAQLVRGGAPPRAALLSDSGALTWLTERGESGCIQLKLEQEAILITGGFLHGRIIGLVYQTFISLFCSESGCLLHHVVLPGSFATPRVWTSVVRHRSCGVYDRGAIYQLQFQDTGSVSPATALLQAVSDSANEKAVSRDLWKHCLKAELHHPALLIAVFSQQRQLGSGVTDVISSVRQRFKDSFLVPSSLSMQLDPLVKETWNLESSIKEAWSEKKRVDDRSSSKAVVHALFKEKIAATELKCVLSRLQEEIRKEPLEVAQQILSVLGLVQQELDTVCLRRWTNLIRGSGHSSDHSRLFSTVISVIAQHKPNMLCALVRVAQAICDKQSDAAYKSPVSAFNQAGLVLQSLLAVKGLPEAAFEPAAEIFLKSFLSGRESTALELFRLSGSWQHVTKLALSCSLLQPAALQYLYKAQRSDDVLQVLHALSEHIGLHQLLVHLETLMKTATCDFTFQMFASENELSVGDVREMLLASFNKEQQTPL